MHNIWTIAQREYRHFFISPIAYVFLVVTLLTLGGFFFLDIMVASQTMQYVPDIQRTLSLLVFPLLFLSVPVITMRTIAEENRTGTLELLLTTPLSDWELVVGKWFGSFLFFLTAIALTWIYPIILNRLISPGLDRGPLLAGYLGLILFVASLTALGVMVSSLFNSQIAALFATFGIVILFWVIGSPAQVMSPGIAADVLRYLSITDHFYNSFLVGVIRIDDIIYYLSLTAFALLLGSVIVETRRWR